MANAFSIKPANQQNFNLPQLTQQKTTTNATGLKTLVCPIDIVAEFLKISYNNTLNKLETCAILAGIERNGQLLITTLIIPPQVGKQD